MTIPDNVFQTVTDLPAGVHAMTCYIGEDDCYRVYLNARDSYIQNRRSFEHELHHIVGDDFSKYDVNEIERKAHDCN